MVRRVAAYGLTGHDAALCDRPLEGGDWQALVTTVRRQRLAGFLHAAIVAGDLPVKDEQHAEADELHLQWCAGAVQLDRRLLQLADDLDAVGIDFLVLKGTAVAHLDYPDPAQRSYGDVDLLFRSEQFDAALAHLSGRGYVRPAAPARPDFDRRFGKGATLRSPDGQELDAHRNLVFGTFGYAIDLDELFDSAVTFELGGRHLKALGPDTRLLHACYHAGLGDPDPRYSSVRDIAQMVTTGDHDPIRTLQLAHRWQAKAVLARGFRLVRDHLGVDLDSSLTRALHGYRSTGRERRAIDSYVGANRHFAAKVVASLPYLKTTKDRAAFVRATALPSRRFAETRGSQPGVAWLRRGVRSLLETRRPPTATKVLWLTKGLGLGGAERLLALTASKLGEAEFEVHVAYLLPGKDALVPELERHGVRTVCLGARRTVDPRWVLRLRRLLRDEGYRVVHTHSPVPAAAARLLAGRSTTLIHTEHNLWSRYRWPTYAVNAATYRRNDAVIAVSDGVAASVEAPRWLPGRSLPPVETLLHGVDLDQVRSGPQARSDARQLLGLDPCTPVIGTVANFTPKKDHAGLLDAIEVVNAAVPDVVALWIGTGPLEGDLRAAVADRGLGGQIRFLGMRDDVLALLPALDVFVLGSRFEGLPISLLEAMAAGIPSVTTRVGGIPEAIDDGHEGLLVEAGDPDALAGAIVKLLRSDALQASMGGNAAERVRNDFSIDRAANRTAMLYRELLA